MKIIRECNNMKNKVLIEIYEKNCIYLENRKIAIRFIN